MLHDFLKLLVTKISVLNTDQANNCSITTIYLNYLHCLLTSHLLISLLKMTQNLLPADN